MRDSMKIEFIFMKDKSSHGSRDKKGLRDNKQKRDISCVCVCVEQMCVCVCMWEYHNIPWEINKK